MQLYEKLLALETELSDLGPRESVDLGVVLKHKDARVGHGKVEVHSFMVLKSQNHRETQELSPLLILCVSLFLCLSVCIFLSHSLCLCLSIKLSHYDS